MTSTAAGGAPSLAPQEEFTVAKFALAPSTHQKITTRPRKARELKAKVKARKQVRERRPRMRAKASIGEEAAVGPKALW